MRLRTASYDLVDLIFSLDRLSASQYIVEWNS